MLQIVSYIQFGIIVVLGYGAAILAVFALVDAMRRRADAYVAADKQSKTTWIVLTGLCAFILVLGALYVRLPLPVQPTRLFWLAALVGVLVYIADVRPNLRRVGG